MVGLVAKLGRVVQSGAVNKSKSFVVKYYPYRSSPKVKRLEKKQTAHDMACCSFDSHIRVSTSVNAILPNKAFCSNLSASHVSSLSAAALHMNIRDWISADCTKVVWPSRDGAYWTRSRHVANWDSDRLTEMIEAICDAGSTNEISRTNASSEPPKNWRRGLALVACSRML